MSPQAIKGTDGKECRRGVVRKEWIQRVQQECTEERLPYTRNRVRGETKEANPSQGIKREGKRKIQEKETKNKKNNKKKTTTNKNNE